MKLISLILLTVVLVRPSVALAETGHDAWLRYQRVEGSYDRFPAVVVVLGATPVLTSCQEELLRGIYGLLGRVERIEKEPPSERAILIGTIASIRGLEPTFTAPGLSGEGYLLRTAIIK